MIYHKFLLLITIFALLACKMDKEPEPLTEQKTLRYLALGDSYTKAESVAASQSFPAQLFDTLKKSGVPLSSMRIIAQTGWTTSNLKSAISNSDLSGTYDLVSLLIGVNNQYQGRSINEYKTQFVELANTAIELAGGKKEHVFVVSIPDYGYTPFGKDNQPSISEQIDLFNKANKQLSDSLGLSYYNITPISRKGLDEPHLVASDGLHPSGLQYKEWVDLFVKDVLKKLQ